MGEEKKKYRFTNRGMFNWVMLHRTDLCARMLTVILGIDIDDVKVRQEESMEPGLDAMRAILDIKAYSNGRVFDIEMQAAKKGNLARRARYYQSTLDTASLEKGSDYKQLPENYVIFICKDDYLGYGEPLLHFTMSCEVNDICESLELRDGRHVMFISASLYNQIEEEQGTASHSLYELMRFISTGKAGEDDLARELEKAVKEANEDEGARMFITQESEIAEWQKALEEKTSENESLKNRLAKSEAENEMLRNKLAKTAKNSASAQ